MRTIQLISALALVAVLSAVLAAQSPTAVTLSTAVSPASGQPGVTTITLTGSGFPTGTILATGVNVKLEPAAGGTAVSTKAATVTTVTGTTRRVTFTIPATIVVVQPTAYLVSISGATSDGTVSFASTNKVSLTINPGPSISLINPNTGQIGQTISVSITGISTNFVQGSTTANFGAGISVGGGALGQSGLVTVTSPTTATAQIRIDSTAQTGTRAVTVATGVQTATLNPGFTVLAGGTPTLVSISLPTVTRGQSNIPIIITGQNTHFTQGTTTVSFGSDITLNGVTVASVTSLTATITVPTTANLGAHTVTVTTGAEIASLANALSVQAAAPNVTFTTPTNLSYLNLSPTTVNGTVDDPTATVTVNSLAAPVANGRFSMSLPLAEGPNIITATATSSSGKIGTASIQVTLDTTPPHVTVTSPPNQFTTTDATISVAGNVNDIVVGTVNDQQAQVTVNGVPAQVANRTFLAMNVPLTVGSNTITAVARDRVGNAATTQITVTRQNLTQAQIRLFSGNNQSAQIGSVAPAPLIVSLTDASGAPAVNKPVIFRVTQNNGMVAAGGAPATSAIATTNSLGQAQAQWTLGMRAGAGSNALEAYSVGFGGTAIFTATGTQGSPGKIVVDTGNDQTGAVNQPLPKPLIAVVVDAGNNRLANVPVTFTVQQGGGSFSGQPSLTVNTDSDGRAAATLTLGFQEGNSNNLVTANFQSNTGFAATFMASGRAPGDPANTYITGVVLDNSNVPIPGVTVRALLTNILNAGPSAVSAAPSTQTNALGQFSIAEAPVGFVKLLIDGSTAQRTGVYPSLEYDIVTVAGQNNTVGQPVFLLPLNTTNQLCVTDTTGGGTLTIHEAPGFSLTVGPGQVTFPGGSKTGCVSVSVVHGDKVPMVPGFGQQPNFIVTIQPSGALFNPPAPITLPNVDGLKPREVTEMYSFDHDIGSFVAIGTGTVSDDGLVIRSNQGVGVLKAGWHCGGNPSPTGAVGNCGACKRCDGTGCITDDTVGCDDGKFCTSADGKNPGPDVCRHGFCHGDPIADVQSTVTADAAKIKAVKTAIENLEKIGDAAGAWMPCWVGSVDPSVSGSEENGTFCCEADRKVVNGNRLSLGGGLSIAANCFVGLTSLAPAIPPKYVQALGVKGSIQFSLDSLKISDVLSSCSGPQWDESINVSLAVGISVVIVDVADIISVIVKGPSGSVSTSLKAENLLSNVHLTGTACISGDSALIITGFGLISLEYDFSLFNKICY